jgi:type IV pilus assembly protein PilW
MNRYRRKQKGLTLIELMIAVAIGLLLLGGTISMFISNKRVYTEQESMGRLQENARFALGQMMYDIRMAGYTGCSDNSSKTSNHVVGGATSTNLQDFSYPLEGSESKSNWQPSGSTDIVGNMVAGTDGVTIRYMYDTGLTVIPPFMNNNSANVRVGTGNGVLFGEIIAVADCDSTDIFQVTNSDASTSGSISHNSGFGPPGNTDKFLSKIYTGSATILRFRTRRYYIGTGAYGGPSLFRQLFAQDKDDSDGDGDTTEVIQHNEELIEGVENMQVLYGEDTIGADKVADTYVTADNVTNWSNVVSVRIALLFRTVKPNSQFEPDTATHSLLGGTAAGGATVGPEYDHYRRRVITATIQVRNKTT